MSDTPQLDDYRFKKAQGVYKTNKQTMVFTAHEKAELLRFADACLAAERPMRARFVRHVAENVYGVELRIYDKVKSLYRNWLCFNQF